MKCELCAMKRHTCCHLYVIRDVWCLKAHGRTRICEMLRYINVAPKVMRHICMNGTTSKETEINPKQKWSKRNMYWKDFMCVHWIEHEWIIFSSIFSFYYFHSTASEAGGPFWVHIYWILRYMHASIIHTQEHNGKSRRCRRVLKCTRTPGAQLTFTFLWFSLLIFSLLAFVPYTKLCFLVVFCAGCLFTNDLLLDGLQRAMSLISCKNIDAFHSSDCVSEIYWFGYEKVLLPLANKSPATLEEQKKEGAPPFQKLNHILCHFSILSGKLCREKVFDAVNAKKWKVLIYSLGHVNKLKCVRKMSMDTFCDDRHHRNYAKIYQLQSLWSYNLLIVLMTLVHLTIKWWMSNFKSTEKVRRNSIAL